MRAVVYEVIIDSNTKSAYYIRSKHEITLIKIILIICIEVLLYILVFLS